MIKVIKVYSDNYDGILFTKDAYKELTLQMSTGDYHTHTAIDTLSPDWTGVVTLEAFNNGVVWDTVKELVNS